MSDTLKLYHYDHCPYCAKARAIFGFKNLNFELIPLLNDDEATPTKLIGQKMLPILITETGRAMPESLDIIKFIDENYGEKPLVQYNNPNPNISKWIQDARAFVYYLAMPRWIKMPLPEFETSSSRLYFQEKKERLSIGSFTTAMEKSIEYKTMAEESLTKLNTVLENSDWFDNKRPLHIDDIHLFATLRSLTTVKDLKWPPQVLEYTKNFASKAKVNLFFDLAI